MRRYKFLKLTTHRKNLGKTAALMTGYKMSRGEYLVIFDADLQFDPWDLPRLMSKLDEGYDIVTGKKVGKYQKPVVSGIYNRICRSLFKVPVTDLNSIKMFRREVLQNMILREDWHRYMVVIAHNQGFKITEIDVKLSPRLHGVSKYSGIWRMFIGFFDLLVVWFTLRFMKKPMLLFGTLGFFSLVGALIVGIIAIVMRFGFDLGYRPLLTLIVMLAQIGITLFIFGALAEMIASLKEKIEFINDNSNRSNINERNYLEERPSAKNPQRSNSKPDRSSNKKKKHDKDNTTPAVHEKIDNRDDDKTAKPDDTIKTKIKKQDEDSDNKWGRKNRKKVSF